MNVIQRVESLSRDQLVSGDHLLVGLKDARQAEYIAMKLLQATDRLQQVLVLLHPADDTWTVHAIPCEGERTREFVDWLFAIAFRFKMDSKTL